MTAPAPPLVFNPFNPTAATTPIFDSFAKAVAAIPAGHTHAIVFDGSYRQGQATGLISFVAKTASGWSVVLDGSYDQPHGFGAEVALAKSW